MMMRGERIRAGGLARPPAPPCLNATGRSGYAVRGAPGRTPAGVAMAAFVEVGEDPRTRAELRELAEQLPASWTVYGGVSVPSAGDWRYRLDGVVAAPWGVHVLELCGLGGRIEAGS